MSGLHRHRRHGSHVARRSRTSLLRRVLKPVYIRAIVSLKSPRDAAGRRADGEQRARGRSSLPLLSSRDFPRAGVGVSRDPDPKLTRELQGNIRSTRVAYPVIPVHSYPGVPKEQRWLLGVRWL